MYATTPLRAEPKLIFGSWLGSLPTLNCQFSGAHHASPRNYPPLYPPSLVDTQGNNTHWQKQRRSQEPPSCHNRGQKPPLPVHLYGRIWNRGQNWSGHVQCCDTIYLSTIFGDGTGFPGLCGWIGGYTDVALSTMFITRDFCTTCACAKYQRYLWGGRRASFKAEPCISNSMEQSQNCLQQPQAFPRGHHCHPSWTSSTTVTC